MAGFKDDGIFFQKTASPVMSDDPNFVTVYVDSNNKLSIIDSDNRVTSLQSQTYSISGQLDFGTGDSTTTTEISASWVTPTTYIDCQLVGETTVDRDPDDIVLENITVKVINKSNGVFTVMAYAPTETFGLFTINCIGVKS